MHKRQINLHPYGHKKKKKKTYTHMFLIISGKKFIITTKKDLNQI